MSTRIRYVKNPDNSLTSMQVFKDKDGHELKLKIFDGGKEGALIFASTQDELVRVRGSSPHKTKIAIKKAAAQLGIRFDSEKRNKTKKENTNEVNLDATLNDSN